MLIKQDYHVDNLLVECFKTAPQPDALPLCVARIGSGDLHGRNVQNRLSPCAQCSNSHTSIWRQSVFQAPNQKVCSTLAPFPFAKWGCNSKSDVVCSTVHSNPTLNWALVWEFEHCLWHICSCSRSRLCCSAGNSWICGSSCDRCCHLFNWWYKLDDQSTCTSMTTPYVTHTVG